MTFFRDADENGSIAVRARGIPFPVQIDYDADALGVVRFARWNTRVVIDPPASFIVIPPSR